ncbi:Uncharacterized protein FWK35_00036147 [Aphis craccivora]|uniref:Uncharacterized protein n=1 Tax=Aphis craccivora TaxID=307492 RepID=A0A6G0VNA1_APHCR|nr:Uncharacterized protein FWK35_00036147 [Aphis craccivora]
MNIPIQIPLGKLRRSNPINKVELTHIDSHLTTKQKKRIARFFREEAAKRTKYNVEPIWTLPNSVKAVKIQPAQNDNLKNIHEYEISPPTTKSSPSPDISDGTVIHIKEPETDNADELEVSTSPLPGTDHERETDDDEEPDLVGELVSRLLTTNQGSYVNLKRNLSTAQTFLKSFEGMSKTQMKRQAYKEKTRHIKALKEQHRL